MSRHANIAVFVPHIGCKNRCSFCDQNAITGMTSIPHAADVTAAVQKAVATSVYDPKNTEIAFFGGSFTAIDPDYRTELLQAAAPYVQNGTVRGIRISTRPDAINEAILDELSFYGVSAIELGAQSMDDSVLALNRRGHTAEDVETASALIRKNAFELGLQMMTGLYGDTERTTTETARKIISIRPDTVRIYPTIVLKNTYLAELVRSGVYVPQTVEQAVDICAELLECFTNENISVIRLGLHSIEQESYIAGPWHPAFSELCYSRLYLKRALSLLTDAGNYVLFVSPTAVSQMIGQKRHNLTELAAHGRICKVCADPSLNQFEIRAERQ